VLCVFFLVIVNAGFFGLVSTRICLLRAGATYSGPAYLQMVRKSHPCMYTHTRTRDTHTPGTSKNTGNKHENNTQAQVETQSHAQDHRITPPVCSSPLSFAGAFLDSTVVDAL